MLFFANIKKEGKLFRYNKNDLIFTYNIVPQKRVKIERKY